MPTITKNLLVINILAYLAMEILKALTASSTAQIDLNSLFGLHFFLASDFHFYQLFTYMFMHGSLQHIFFNMFALWMFGCVVEQVWGAKKFLFYYILCGIGAGLFQEGAQFVQYSMEGLAAYDGVNLNGMKVSMEAFLNSWTTVGASGAVYGILLAFGMIFPNQRIFIFPLPVPIKAKWFVLIYAAIELFSAMSTTNDGVAHVAHLGGMIFGYFLIRYWRNHANNRYDKIRGSVLFGGLQSNWKKRDNQNYNRNTSSTFSNITRTTDEEYNKRQKENQQAIDAILDKIRKSGYDSLSDEEKQMLFNNSNHN